jgi:hypothetical protein
MSTTPSIRVTKNTPERVGDQQPPVRYDLQYLVVMIGALPSSDQMRAVQSPTVMKNLENLCPYIRKGAEYKKTHPHIHTCKVSTEEVKIPRLAKDEGSSCSTCGSPWSLLRDARWIALDGVDGTVVLAAAHVHGHDTVV